MKKNTKKWLVNQLLDWFDSKESNIFNLSSIHRFLLISLSKFYNSKTFQCNPSYSRLSKMTGIHRTKIPIHLKELEKKGLIKIISKEKKNGSKDNNQYDLIVDKLIEGSSQQLLGVVANSYQGSSQQLPPINKQFIKLSNLTNKKQELAAHEKNKRQNMPENLREFVKTIGRGILK